jgi:hypothetical protein
MKGRRKQKKEGRKEEKKRCQQDVRKSRLLLV